MIYEKLYDYQKKIIDTYEDKENFGLFVDMGVGKTPLSLAFAERHNCNKILVITVNSKALEDETVNGSFFKWINLCDTKYNLYNKYTSFDKTGPKKYHVELQNDSHDILMINYESLFVKDKDTHTAIGRQRRPSCKLKDKIVDFINSCRNQNLCIIIDESQKMKNKDSVTFSALDMIRKMSKRIAKSVHIYLLTGTPFTRGFEDLYTQLYFLGWDKTWTYFKDTFCILGEVPTLKSWEQPIIDYKNLEMLFHLIHKYAITFKSEEVLDLPEQVFVEHKLDMNRCLKLFTYQKVKANIINQELAARNLTERVQVSVRDGAVINPFYGNIAYPDLSWIADTMIKFYMRAKQLSIGFQGNSERAIWYNKDRLMELERLLNENPDNYILFYNYTPEFIEIYDICEKLGYKVDVFNGIIKSETHYINYSNLSEGLKLVEKKRIMLVNYASGSMAKNWQEYNKCILFSLPVFADYQQAIKRVHRPGQKNTVTYHVFYEDNWLDNRMLSSLKERKEYDEQMFEKDLKSLHD